MTIRSALKQYPRPETELLLGHVLKQSKEFLYMHPEHILSSTQVSKFNQLLTQLKQGQPVAYLLGYKYFYGLKFKVNRYTLIPRPESEWLVNTAITLTKHLKLPKIIDLGTGSGCLAISIAKFSTNKPKIVATDISKKALELAKYNSKQHNVKISFKVQNLLNKDNNKYDLIIANLPYVPLRDYQKYLTNLQYEPKKALVDPVKDFYLYENLFLQFPKNLNKNGSMLLEIDPSMKPLIQKWFKKNMPHAKLSFARDIRKLIRYCIITNHSV